jgi:xanthine dehydrogenase YagS FAD-binding subunit
VAVHPSDTAPALVALGASIKTTKRVVPVEEFFAVGPARTTVLENDELVTEIQVPAPPEGARSAFIKFAQRSSIDFSVVNCAALVTCVGNTVKGARICLNAVYVIPYRAVKAEQAVVGRALDEAAAEDAGKAAVSGARPLANNAYMVQVAKTLVKRAVLACGGTADG